MDNKNQNEHNKQCTSMSSSELDHKTDYCLTNLKILAKIKVGDKLCFDDSLQHFSLDEWSYTQPLTRWWQSEGRGSTIKSLDEFIATDNKDYISKAISFSDKNNLNNLNILRKSLREKASLSPLFDSKLFAENFSKKIQEVINNYT